MTRLEMILSRTDTQECGHPEDVRKIKRTFPELGILPDSEIEEIYCDYSDSYSAGWLILDVQTMNDFANWLEEEMDKEKDQDEKEKVLIKAFIVRFRTEVLMEGTVFAKNLEGATKKFDNSEFTEAEEIHCYSRTIINIDEES